MAERAWISQVKNLFVESPLVSHVVFGFLLTALEKLVEVEFVCPCYSTIINFCFAAAFFLVPALLASLLMINIQGYKKEEWKKMVLFSGGPAVVWITLMFFGGQYFACGRTHWSGTFVTDTEAAPKKWCKPANFSSSSGDELKKTLRWYSLSQGIGMVCVIVITLVLGIYVIIMCTKEQKKTEDPPGHVEEHQNPEASTQFVVNRDTTQST